MTFDQSLAFFTGPGDPQGCGLSPEQEEFLDSLARPGLELIRRNFPFSVEGVYRPLSLPVASVQNVAAYLRSRSPAFAAKFRDPVSRLILRSERTFFLVGSCGLELFNNLHLAREVEKRCTLICFGPVARRHPRHAACVIMQSRRDLISRTFFSSAPSMQLRGGHMDYLQDPVFRATCRRLLNQTVLA